MGVGDWVVVVALVAATAFGLHRAFTDGRFRGTHAVRGAQAPAPDARPAVDPVPDASDEAYDDQGASARDRHVLTADDLGAALGERATLLQFSSAFCAPCRATRHVLADVAATVPGVAHVEVDAESHLELVRRLGVSRTPTTVVLAADGGEVTRAAGAVRKPQVLQALAGAVD